MDAGNYSVRYTDVNGCVSPYATVSTVVVNERPAQALVVTNAPVCTGESFNLTSGTTGTLYEWFGPDGGSPSFSSTTTNDTTLTSASTVYLAGEWRVRVTDVNGCVSELSDPVTVTLSAIPATPTAAATTTCVGEDLTLSTPTVADATYAWTGPGGFTSNFQNPTSTNTTTADNGTYNVQVSVDGCTSAAGSVAVTINENPIAIPTNNGGACGADLELFANASGGSTPYTYAWTGPNSFNSNLQNPVISNPTAANEGSYTVTITDSIACVSTAASTQVTLITSNPFEPSIAGNHRSCDVRCTLGG